MSTSCSWYDVGCFFGWLADEFKHFYLWAYDKFVGGLSAIVDAIPVPDFLLNMGTFEIPSGVVYFSTAFEIPYGISVCVAAYTARFILRRIPFIG